MSCASGARSECSGSTHAREATPAVLAEILDALGKVGGLPDLGVVLAADLPAALEPARALALARR